MNRFVKIGVIMCVLLGCAVSPASAKRWYEYYRDAEKAAKSGKWQEAVGLLEKALGSEPHSAKGKWAYGTTKIDYYPYVKLGQAYLALDDLAAARENCEREQAEGVAPESVIAACLKQAQGRDKPQNESGVVEKPTKQLGIATSRFSQGLKNARGLVEEAPPPSIAPRPDIDFGRYYAIVIGNNAYRFLDPLQTAQNDARAVADILTREYGFDVKLLLDATRTDILQALNDARKTLTERDNLLIYYAGHGYLDHDADEGYWLPVDAEADNNLNWIQNAALTTELKALNSKHALIVSDSCYSGTLTRGSGKIGLKKADYLRRLAEKKTRAVIAAGGLEPVADAGGEGGHSVFAAAFLHMLRENQEPAIDVTTLFPTLRMQVMLNAEQEPIYRNIRNAGGDVDGDFVFVRPK